MLHLFLIFFSVFLPLAVIFYARFIAPLHLEIRKRVFLGSLTVFLIALISFAIPISLKLARDPDAFERYHVGTWLPWMYGIMTFVFLAVMCVIVRDIVWMIARIVRAIRERKKTVVSEAEGGSTSAEYEYAAISRREFLKRTSTYVTIGSAVALTPVSIYHAKKCRKVREVDIRMERFPSSLDGLRIVHLSDIHVGNTIDEDDVAAIVEETNALNPDIIAITGDMVDGMPEHIGAWLEPMRNFKAKYGVWFVTGNHDHLWNAHGWCEVINNLGIHVLDNAHEVVDISGTKIAIAGAIDVRGDRWDRNWRSDPVKALSSIDENLFRLMLVHQPSSVDKSFAAGADLVLLGHTHGGQCWPLNYVIDAMHKYSRGLYELDGGKTAFVSCGTGYWGPPMRFGIPPEINVLTLYHR